MSTARFDTLRDAAGNNPSTALQIQQGRAKAWFNLNGTGTIAVRDSFNISSVTDLSTGNYSPAFSTERPNSNYVITASVGDPAFVTQAGTVYPSAQTVSAFNIGVRSTVDPTSPFDCGGLNVSIDGD